MPIILIGPGDTVDPEPPPEKQEPLSESESTRLTATDAARLIQACASLGVSKSAFIRAAVLAKLDTTGK